MSRSINLTDKILSNHLIISPNDEAQHNLIAQIAENDSKHVLMGERVIAFWIDRNETKWYLGVVERMINDNPVISYMIRTDKKEKSWTYPGTAEILETKCVNCENTY